MVVEVISNHLLSNRKLVVPTLGAFIVKESGDRVFSDLLREDDGVLTSLLRERGLNEMEAAITLERFIFEVRHELELYGYYRLGELGTLRVEPDTKVLRLYPAVQPTQEVTHVHTPYVPEPSVSVEPEQESESVSTETFETQTEVVKNEPEESVTPRRNTNKSQKKGVDILLVLVIAIIVVILLMVGYGAYISMF